MREMQLDKERRDLREFQIGELVKVANDITGINGIRVAPDYSYYHVLEDNRFKKHCTYTYSLMHIVKEYSEDNGIRVYGYFPRNIEPTNETEKVLYAEVNPHYL